MITILEIIAARIYNFGKQFKQHNTTEEDVHENLPLELKNFSPKALEILVEYIDMATEESGSEKSSESSKKYGSPNMKCNRSGTSHNKYISSLYMWLHQPIIEEVEAAIEVRQISIIVSTIKMLQVRSLDNYNETLSKHLQQKLSIALNINIGALQGFRNYMTSLVLTRLNKKHQIEEDDINAFTHMLQNMEKNEGIIILNYNTMVSAIGFILGKKWKYLTLQQLATDVDKHIRQEYKEHNHLYSQILESTLETTLRHETKIAKWFEVYYNKISVNVNKWSDKTISNIMLGSPDITLSSTAINTDLIFMSRQGKFDNYEKVKQRKIKLKNSEKYILSLQSMFIEKKNGKNSCTTLAQLAWTCGGVALELTKGNLQLLNGKLVVDDTVYATRGETHNSNIIAIGKLWADNEWCWCMQANNRNPPCYQQMFAALGIYVTQDNATMCSTCNKLQLPKYAEMSEEMLLLLDKLYMNINENILTSIHTKKVEIIDYVYAHVIQIAKSELEKIQNTTNRSTKAWRIIWQEGALPVRFLNTNFNFNDQHVLKVGQSYCMQANNDIFQYIGNTVSCVIVGYFITLLNIVAQCIYSLDILQIYNRTFTKLEDEYNTRITVAQVAHQDWNTINVVVSAHNITNSWINNLETDYKPDNIGRKTFFLQAKTSMLRHNPFIWIFSIFMLLTTNGQDGFLVASIAVNIAMTLVTVDGMLHARVGEGNNTEILGLLFKVLKQVSIIMSICISIAITAPSDITASYGVAQIVVSVLIVCWEAYFEYKDRIRSRTLYFRIHVAYKIITFVVNVLPILLFSFYKKQDIHLICLTIVNAVLNVLNRSYMLIVQLKYERKILY